MLFFLAAGAGAKTLWVDRNIYSSGANLRAGDVLIVEIRDMSRMNFNMSVSDDRSATVSSSPDVNITGFLPKVSSDRKLSGTDRVRFSGQGRISLSIAATIRNRAAGGLFRIAGSRTYAVNGISNRITVTGLVNPSFVKGRRIAAENVADLRMDISTTKEGIAIRRPKPGKDEKASVELTEEEKQRIIIDYLQKMLRELTR